MEIKKKIEHFEKAHDVASKMEDFFKKQTEATRKFLRK